jgi:hypothetical protein
MCTVCTMDSLIIKCCSTRLGVSGIIAYHTVTLSRRAFVIKVMMVEANRVRANFSGAALSLRSLKPLNKLPL